MNILQVDLAKVKLILEQIARSDIELLLSTGHVNTDLIEDNNKLKTIVDNISDASIEFITRLSDLGSEISRIELLLDDSKPTVDKVKSMLKLIN